MPDGLPISDLPEASLPLGGSEALPVVQAGVTVQVPAAALAAVVGQAVLFEQGADLAARTLVDVVEAGVYEIVGVLSCTSAAAGAGQVTLGVTWTDLNGFQTFGLVLLDMDVLGSDEGTLNEFCGAASVIQFSVIQPRLQRVQVRGGSIGAAAGV